MQTNPYAQAIHNVTRYEPRLIADTIAGIERKVIPIEQKYPTREWDIYMLYRVIKEYERLHEPTKSA